MVDNDRKQIDEPDNATNGSLRKIVSLTSKVDNSELNFQDKSKPKQFTEDEKRETGAIKARIYKEYLGTSGGFWFWLPILLLFVVYQGIILGRSWFIGLWTRSYNSSFLVEQSLTYSHAVLSKIVNPMKSQHQGSNDLSFYLDVYLGLSVLICILGTLRYFLVYLGSIRASKGLFDRLTYAVLRAPLRWLDITPVGRILNRFTADFAAIDSRLGNDLGFLLYQIVQLIGIIVAGLFVSVWMLLIALILFAVCSWITARFLVGAREIKRLESNAKSPIFEQFGTALVGIGTIRAYDKVDVYVERMFENIDAHARAFWYLWLFNRWVAFRLNVIGAGFAILVAAVIVFSGIDASLAGFALSFALQYSNALLWTARCYANVELALNSVERVFEYSKIPTEKQEATINVPAAWPTKGQIEVSNLVAGYASDLPPVLKGLSFAVERNQRIGVVGRTGAGKSSLTLALFRFLEASEGSICIDGIDVSKISLHDLRSRVAIIPQDPVLFSGTLRSNLDAFDEHTNSELYDALERVHLAQSTGTSSRDEHLVPSGPAEGSSSTAAVPATDVNINVFASLSSRISEGGLNLSQGQRQLLCLARAIVSRPKIMVLDEATSAVDMATDVLIQRSIREDFRDSTLLVIAHRLSTIADFDRILVMEDGRAVEFDSPRALLAKKEKGSVFKGMVEQSGEKDKLREIILGSGSSSREGGGEEVS